MVSWFDPEEFERLRVARGVIWGRPVRLLESTSSTNDLGLEAISTPAKTGIVWLAREQTGGRGRRGTAWVSTPGENMTLSILLRVPGPLERASGFSLLVGLALREVIEGTLRSPRSIQVKWPNDVLIDGKKCAGILIESRLGAQQELALVVGVGLNVLAREFPPFLQEATSLAREDADPARLDFESLLVSLLHALERRTPAFLKAGPASLLDELERHDFLRGKRLRVGEDEGEGAGFDERGHLLLRQEDGSLRTVLTGHVEFLDALTPG